MGGKVIDFNVVMGEYDYMVIAEFPSDEAQMTFSPAFGSRGDTRGITLKAFSKEEFTKMVEKLP